MNKTSKVVLGVGITAGTFFLGKYVFGLSSLQKKLEIRQKISISKVSLSGGIEIRIDVTARNPTGQGINIQNPHVTLYYKDQKNFMGQSLSGAEQINIKPYGTTQFDPIFVNVDVFTALNKFPAIVQEIKNSGTITIKAVTDTFIDKILPYKQTDNIALKVPGLLVTLIQNLSLKGLAGTELANLLNSDRAVIENTNIVALTY